MKDYRLLLHVITMHRDQLHWFATNKCGLTSQYQQKYRVFLIWFPHQSQKTLYCQHCEQNSLPKLRQTEYVWVACEQRWIPSLAGTRTQWRLCRNSWSPESHLVWNQIEQIYTENSINHFRFSHIWHQTKLFQCNNDGVFGNCNDTHYMQLFVSEMLHILSGLSKFIASFSDKHGWIYLVNYYPKAPGSKWLY